MTQPQSHPGLVITIKYSLGFNYQPNKIIIDKKLSNHSDHGGIRFAV